jgi:hypothetical protein
MSLGLIKLILITYIPTITVFLIYLKEKSAVTELEKKLKVAEDWIEKETDCVGREFPCSRCDLLKTIRGENEKTTL